MKIFYDIDTQRDFMNQDGALYVPNAELIKPKLKELTSYAKKNNSFHIIGSVDRHFGTEEYKHREGELQRWGGPFPDHCMDKSFGIGKIEETKLTYPDARGEFFRSEYYGFSNSFCHPHYLDERVDEKYLSKAIGFVCETKWSPDRKPGIFFEKQSYDIFTNPAFEVFLEKANVKEAVVYGVATDYCVKAAVLGMQERGIQCYVVEDAIKGVAPDATKQALKEMTKVGAKFTTTKEVIEQYSR
ncbi:hypothetical protein AYK26_05965 [Euryarchaeota archaeon SM23-78]|nr:MAG: hypothetical protein AYK26_05965 [Euryarchaeota archaeon SM23-78]MBW3000588.1 cysteine hydrolase family protein [Candidatus Woesearchaeota archaeon]